MNNDFKMNFLSKDDFEKLNQEYDDKPLFKIDVTDYQRKLIDLIKTFPTKDYHVIGSINLTMTIHFLMEMIDDFEETKSIISQSIKTARQMTNEMPNYYKSQLEEDSEEDSEEDFLENENELEKKQNETIDKPYLSEKLSRIFDLFLSNNLYATLINNYKNNNYEIIEFIGLLVTFTTKLVLENISEEKSPPFFEKYTGLASDWHAFQIHSLTEKLKKDDNGSFKKETSQ